MHIFLFLCILFICLSVFCLLPARCFLVRDQSCKGEIMSILQNLKVQSITVKLLQIDFHWIKSPVGEKNHKAAEDPGNRQLSWYKNSFMVEHHTVGRGVRWSKSLSKGDLGNKAEKQLEKFLVELSLGMIPGVCPFFPVLLECRLWAN